MSRNLYHLLQNRYNFVSRKYNVELEDGNIKETKLLTAGVSIDIKNNSATTDMVVLSTSSDNRTSIITDVIA